MHYRRIHIVFLLLFITCVAEAQEIYYATRRLENMAKAMSLTNVDTLHIGRNYQFAYHNKPLTIRVNEWKEIEHIGFRLFSDTLKEAHPSPVYDFLERYFLEKNLYSDGSEEKIRLKWEKVLFVVGDENIIFNIDSTCNFSYSYEELRRYNVIWSKGQDIVLQMKFDMDYQLLSGCSISELETNFIRSLKRMPKLAKVPQKKINFPNETKAYTYTGSNFISPYIRNDIYFTKKRDMWEPVASRKVLTRSISNMMLDYANNDTLVAKLILRGYGDYTDSVIVNYSHFISTHKNAGYDVYFGLKYKDEKNFSGTLFLVNKRAGFLHLLSVNAPIDAIEDKRNCRIEGEIFPYIPLFNVSNKILNPKQYQPIVTEDI